jgi:hypothetical protein
MPQPYLSPKAASSNAILLSMVDYLRIHGPTALQPLAAAIQCGDSTLSGSKVIGFNEKLAQLGSEWRVKATKSNSPNGGHILTWSVIPKPVRTR